MNKITIHPDMAGSVINKNIYGHFSEHLGRCIYEGIFVGKDSLIPNTRGIRNDVVEALKHIKVPVLRWPGGCFADEYHWKDGIGPQEERKTMINSHWGGVTEDNSFGTHEFLDLCELVGCEPYINGNLGSGTVQEMSEWVEYLNSGDVSPMTQLRKKNGREAPWNVKYFGVGNENWGCGGNMRPSYYADEYRRYQTYLRRYGDRKIFKIACGANSFDYEWTKVLMEVAGRYMDALTLHYYTLPTGNWADKGSATQFDTAAYYATLKQTLRMEELIEKHLAIMDEYDPEHRVGMIIDEWGSWYNVEPGTNPGFLYQQNTMRDALIAGINLNLFNNNADRVIMTNIAQTINVLQAVLLTDGAKLVKTPTYHVFDLFKAHQDARLVKVELDAGTIELPEGQIPRVSTSASNNGKGELTLTLAHLHDDEAMNLRCAHIPGYQLKEAKILTGAITDFNDFDSPDKVRITAFDGVSLTEDGLNIALPPCSVLSLSFMAN